MCCAHPDRLRPRHADGRITQHGIPNSPRNAFLGISYYAYVPRPKQLVPDSKPAEVGGRCRSVAVDAGRSACLGALSVVTDQEALRADELVVLLRSDTDLERLV